MLKKIVCQLPEEHYSEFREELHAGRGEKFISLLALYREPGLDEEKIRESIRGSDTAFYTLKSRLQDKLQDFLFRKASGDGLSLDGHSTYIHRLVYNAPRETAICILEYMEAHLRRQDMPREIIDIYGGLKKLSLNTDRFYHYQQLYNKSVAYALALDKSEEQLVLFNREMGRYLLSLDKEVTTLLGLYLRELGNISSLYDSHRIRANRLLARLSFVLFTRQDDAEGKTTEELLQELRAILDGHSEDIRYYYLDKAWHFYNFLYYHQLGLSRNAAPSFASILESLDSFFCLNHTCPVSVFLIAWCEREKDPSLIRYTFFPEAGDALSLVNHALAQAICLFRAGRYADASAVLNRLVNETGLRNALFAESQVKLLLALMLLLAEKTEQAELTIRSISRKLASEESAGEFLPAQSFVRFLKTALTDNSKKKEEKLREQFNAFLLVNRGPAAIPGQVQLEDSHYRILSR